VSLDWRIVAGINGGAFAKPWFATYQDCARAQGAGGQGAGPAFRQKATRRKRSSPRKVADEILKPYVEQTSLRLPRS
jgi:sn-glycerol 3-phosphate transport system substrate-binding protein